MTRNIAFFFLNLVFLATSSKSLTQKLPPPCQSEIYCHGKLLHTIQLAKLYHDSKTFVDKKLRYKPDLILEKFSELLNNTESNPSREELQLFVDQHFDNEGSEFETWEPSDWVSDPDFLKKINNSMLKNWGRELHDAWNFLGRQIKDDVRVHPELYSMIYVPNPFIIPGGRFREFYYWDSYWIIRGLIISQMTETVKGMLENFLLMVDSYGLVPNGGRVYYEQRSQPPLLIPMVDSYINATGDIDFLHKNIHLLEKELQFWLENRTVTVKGHTLCRFNVEFEGPRPESYKEDYEAASNLDAKDRQEFYVNTKSGAESGWDFSSRWYIVDDGTNEGNMSHINTRYVIPVDLNSFVCMNNYLLSEMFLLVGNKEKASFYRDKFLSWREAIKEVLWNEEEGVWFDYDVLNNKPRSFFYASNLAPLWARCWDTSNTSTIDSIATRILSYLEKTQATNFVGGLPTSMLHTGQQWDFPNGWPPLQHLLVVGLENTAEPKAQALALMLAKKWLLNNYKAYQQTMPNAMFEKYDVTVIGLPGGGGEYDVQLGFGWTNGVILDFLHIFGDRLSIDEAELESTLWPLISMEA